MIHSDLQPIHRIVAGITQIAGQRMSWGLVVTIRTGTVNLIMVENTNRGPCLRRREMAGVTYRSRI